MSTPVSDAYISPRANSRFHAAMDVRQTRRNNLAALLAARGARKALAEAVDSDPAYLSQLPLRG